MKQFCVVYKKRYKIITTAKNEATLRLHAPQMIIDWLGECATSEILIRGAYITDLNKKPGVYVIYRETPAATVTPAR